MLGGEKMNKDQYLKKIKEIYDLKEINQKLKELQEYVKTHKFEDIEEE